MSKSPPTNGCLVMWFSNVWHFRGNLTITFFSLCEIMSSIWCFEYGAKFIRVGWSFTLACSLGSILSVRSKALATPIRTSLEPVMAGHSNIEYRMVCLRDSNASISSKIRSLKIKGTNFHIVKKRKRPTLQYSFKRTLPLNRWFDIDSIYLKYIHTHVSNVKR